MNNEIRQAANPRHSFSSRDSDKNPFGSVLSAAVRGFIVFLALSFVLLFVLSLAAYLTPDPGSLVRVFSLAALYLPAFIGGATAGKCGESKFTAALFCGLLCTAAVAVIGLFFQKATETPVWLRLLMYLAVTAFSLFGIAASSGKKKGRSPHRQYKKHK